MGLLLCIFVSLCVAIPARAEPDSQKRELTIELEEVTDATQYEIEIKPIDRGSSDKQFTFKNQKPTFKVKLRPGKFEIRLRAIDDRGAVGEWSPPAPLAVAPKAVELIAPEAGAIIHSQDTRKVNFAWANTSGAEAYKLVVETLNGESILQEEFTSSSTQFSPPPGGHFRWYVLSRYSKDLYSEKSESSPREFTYIGPPLSSPKISNHELTYLKWKSDDQTQNVELTLYNANIKGTNQELTRKSLKPSSGFRYKLEDRNLYKIILVAKNPLFENSKEETVYFERQGQELIVYGESRPDDSDRLASKGWRWLAAIKRSSFSFEGSNTQYGFKTNFEDANGANVKIGVIHKGRNFDHRSDVNYSQFSVEAPSGEVSSALTQINYSSLWLRNIGFKNVPINLAFGFAYDEVPEFIGASSGVLALQYLRTVNVSAGFESTYQFSRKRALQFDFQLAFPVMSLQIPNGSLKKSSRANIDLHYLHDFKKLTGIIGLEIQGHDFNYGEGSYFNFSSGGLSLGFMY